MSKILKTDKKTVELQPQAPAARPSRIRRDPLLIAPLPETTRKMWWHSNEWERHAAIIGLVMFAIALTIITVGFGAITSWGDRIG